MKTYNHWKAWALLRDGELYRTYPLRRIAIGYRNDYRHGSKHKWRVVKVLVSTRPGI